MATRKTTPKFIEEAQKIHKSLYDYSNVNYINCSTPVIIVCKKHGNFPQKPETHLLGSGCRKCAYEKFAVDKAEFIDRATKLHKGKYTYNNIIFINLETEVLITCPNHTDFPQTPAVHLQNHGCPECGKNSSIKSNSLSNEDLDRFLIENNIPIIRIGNYIRSKDKIDFKCLICNHIWPTRPNGIKQGNRCPECNKERMRLEYKQELKNLRRKSKEQFIIEANIIHKNKYDYSLIEYKNTYTDINIICKNHGPFNQSPHHHLQGRGCKQCGIESHIQKTIFTNEIVDNYLLNNNICIKRVDNYIHSQIYMNWQCLNCNHIWPAKPTDILRARGSGCPICAKPKNEKIIRTYLNDINIDFIHNYCFKFDNKKFFVDFYIKSMNLIIEYNGEQHYEPVCFNGMSKSQANIKFENQKIRDNKLRKYCKDNNINLLEIDGRKYKNKKLIQFIAKIFSK